jgi:nucleoside-diphosphate-sugar epimerase
VIIAGCGFLGEAAADLFFGAGWQVLGLVASDESARRLAGKPYAIGVVDITKAFDIEAPWQGADALVHCASTNRGGTEAYRKVYLEGLLNTIAAVKPRRSLFVSSTSVYAQTDGSLVNERSETKPLRAAGLYLLDAEGVARASGGYVARLSGLYGPGRSVLTRKFLSGEAVLEERGERWINQIHRDDAARAIVHLFSRRAAPEIYNVTDDAPMRQRDLYQTLANHFHKPMPPAGPRAADRKRAWTSKRVSNERLRATGWAPIYPSFREALAAKAV